MAVYPQGPQVLHQLLCGGDAQQDRADPLTPQAPGWGQEINTHKCLGH